MTHKVDSYRFVDFMTRKVAEGWIAREKPREIPWAPLDRPLDECRVSLISSGGIALKSDQPFDHEVERRDLNCVLPLQRLAELEASGEIGSVAPRHYSFMGYTLDPTTLLEESTPSMVQLLQEDEVDLVVLVPI